jgi:hypothetical protein
MKHVLPVLPVLLATLAACGTAHPLSGLTRTGTATAAGFSFRVNHSNTDAQATRTNSVWRPSYPQVQAAAVLAVAEVTGCIPRATTATGDVALIAMKIDC